jgi:hypothetical protein
MHQTSSFQPRQIAIAGTLAGLLSTAVLAWAGKRHNRRPLGPLNAPAHWVWGDESLAEDAASVRHTVVGVVIHQLSSGFWAAVHEWLQSRRSSPTMANAALDAAAVTAIAAVVDLKLVPDRLTPGFQRRIPPRSVALTYLAFAAGLTAAAALRRR